MNKRVFKLILIHYTHRVNDSPSHIASYSKMEGEDRDRGDVVCREEEPLLPATYVYFRVGRERKHASIYARFVWAVFKFCFCSIGLWGHQAWNYIPRVLFSVLCVCQVGFVFSFIVSGCQDLPCSSNTTAPKKNDLGTEEIFDGLLSVAAIVSYLPFIGCFMAAKRKNSALVCPSQSMVDVHRVTEMYLLFVAFLSFHTMTGWTALLYKMENIDIISAIGYGTICSAHWASANTCNIFAVSSFALGTFTQDTLRLIRNIQNGTLDDMIRIHEDLCTVVFNTVSAYSVWFVLHWFTYGATVLIGAIYVSKEISLKTPTKDMVSFGFLFVCLLYHFLLPCICAAHITSYCAGVYEKINRTISTDWNEGHPFRDRKNIDLFISYAKDRQCGFKVCRITFNTSLAWLSFFFGLTALMFHFI